MVMVMFFETTKITFKRIGSRGDLVIHDKVKQIRQGFHEHRSGAEEITEDPAAIGRLIDRWTESTFPGLDSLEKVTRLLLCLHLKEAKEDLTKISGITPLRVSAAPAQALALHMHQTTLECDGRPCVAQALDLRGFSIGGGTQELQSVIGQHLIELQEAASVLCDSIGGIDHVVRPGIHHGIDQRTMIQEGAVTDDVMNTINRDRRRGRMQEPVTNRSPQARGAHMTDHGELTNTVALTDPLSEPMIVVGRR